MMTTTIIRTITPPTTAPIMTPKLSGVPVLLVVSVVVPEVVGGGRVRAVVSSDVEP